MERQDWVEYLNQCLAEDPEAIQSLFDHHAIVNSIEESNPLIVRYDSGKFVTSCLGLINGMIIGRPINKVVDEATFKIVRFE